MPTFTLFAENTVTGETGWFQTGARDGFDAIRYGRQEQRLGRDWDVFVHKVEP